MKTALNILLTGIAFSLSCSARAMPEIPFCPAGGPPGWFNYFTDRHNHSTWQYQHYYHSPYPLRGDQNNYHPVYVPASAAKHARRMSNHTPVLTSPSPAYSPAQQHNAGRHGTGRHSAGQYGASRYQNPLNPSFHRKYR